LGTSAFLKRTQKYKLDSIKNAKVKSMHLVNHLLNSLKGRGSSAIVSQQRYEKHPNKKIT
jgi:hypothetical protein